MSQVIRQSFECQLGVNLLIDLLVHFLRPYHVGVIGEIGESFGIGSEDEVGLALHTPL